MRDLKRLANQQMHQRPPPLPRRLGRPQRRAQRRRTCRVARCRAVGQRRVPNADRQRGGRGRTSGNCAELVIVAANVTSAVSCAKFVDAAQRAYGAHVLCVQEPKVGSAGEIAVQRAWQSAGWHGIHGTARLTGVDAFSKYGGVAALAKKFIGVGIGGPWESPVTEQARAVVGKVATAARHGWAIASVYLITAEGASPAKLSILDGVHRRLTAIGGPRIVGGGFQMSYWSQGGPLRVVTS